jgi:transposase
VNKRFRVCDLNQPLLIPPCLQDWLPEGHLARFIADVGEELDLSGIYAEYERHDSRGLSAYHPLLLTRLLLYGYSLGITSSRAIEKATYDNIAFRYLAADQHPDHDTIAAFRQEHLDILAGLFVQALRLCQKAGLVKLGNVALDGTKIKANASTRRSVDYKQLKEREQYWQGVVEGLLQHAQQTDEEEDRRFGPGQPADRLPEELASAKSRLERIRRAKAELEKEAKEQLEAAAQNYIPRKRGRPRKEEQETQPPRTPQQRRGDRKRFRRAEQNASEPGRQYNFVDPDSRVLRDSSTKSFVQGYNAQAGVDSQAQVIVAAEVTQQPTDRRQLVPMVNSIRQSTESIPAVVTADAGYWDTESLQDASLKGIQMLVSPDATPQPTTAALPAHAPRNDEAVRMREVLASPAGKALYTQRKATVEAVFGQIKEARGIRRFRLRGLQSVRCEWKLICATHNLLKLFRHRPLPSPA